MKTNNLMIRSFTTLAAAALMTTFASAQSNEQKIANLEARCTKLEALVTTLGMENLTQKLQLSTLELKTKYMSVSGTTTKFSGTNVQIVKDSGSFWAPNGLGNLIIGYNQVRSDGAATTRTGSHNLVMGNENSYSGVLGIVGGFRNRLEGNFSAIISGRDNAVTNSILETNQPHTFGVIMTGTGNNITGLYNSITSGAKNYCSGTGNVVLTGSSNAASQFTNTSGSIVQPYHCLVGTGDNNRAKFLRSAVFSGESVWATGISTAIGGGSSYKNSTYFNFTAGN